MRRTSTTAQAPRPAKTPSPGSGAKLSKTTRAVETTSVAVKPGPRLPPSISERRMALTMASRERDELIRNWEVALAPEIRPALDLVRLDRAFRHMLALHPRLRAIYEIKKDDVAVRLLPLEAFKLNEQDATGLSDEQFLAMLREANDRPWSISKGPQIALTAFTRPRGRTALLLRMNHLIVDGWSIEVLLRDMIMFYLGVPAGSTKVADFSNFVQWEKKFEASHEGRMQREFWRRKLSRLGPRLKLPYDRPPTSPLIRSSGNVNFGLPKAQMERVRTLASRTGASVFGFMLAAYQILLHHLSGETDLTALTTTARRTNPDFANTVGLVANLIALRGFLATQSSFQLQVSRASKTVLEAMSNQECDISSVSRDLAAEELGSANGFGTADSAFDQVGLYMLTANQSGGPDAALRMRYAPETKMRVGPFELRGLPLNGSDCTRELTLFFNEIDGELLAFFSYNADIFDVATIEGFARTFTRIVELGLEAPSRSVADIVKEL